MFLCSTLKTLRPGRLRRHAAEGPQLNIPGLMFVLSLPPTSENRHPWRNRFFPLGHHQAYLN